GVHAIDTGAVWGGRLTALQLDTDELRVVQVPGREVDGPPPIPRAPRPPREGGQRDGGQRQGGRRPGQKPPQAPRAPEGANN
ncbi:hypothetical protein SB769_38885, partial [Burkholderia sp. SIMBA_024]